MSSNRIERGGSDYPKDLRDRLGDAAPACLYAMGESQILRHCLLGLVCSIQCPGSIVIKTLDAVRKLRDAGVAVVGGFHSPMEKECLEILLRGKQPVILCAAKRLMGLRIGNAARCAINESRLLVLSAFGDNIKRTIATQAVRRNNLVAALAYAIWVPYAAPGGKVWATVQVALARKQPVYTVEDESNKELLSLGARSIWEIL